MKILVVSQHYYPEPFRVTRITESLVSRGHEVTVLTGIPNYPEGVFYPGYSYKQRRRETINGVNVIRVREHPRKKDLINRAINYYSYGYFGSREAKKLPGDFDVILAFGLSPIYMEYPAIAYKKKYGTPILLYEMDLWPASLTAGGVKPSSPIYKRFEKVSKKVYSQMDRILVSSPAHVDYIRGLIGDEIEITPLLQFADDLPLEKHRLQENAVNVLFAGNLGKAQNLESLMKCAELLSDDPRIHFNIAGSGSEADYLKDFVTKKQLRNVSLLGRLSKEGLRKVYEETSVGLVGLSDELFSRLTIPGKVQSYLKMGLPVYGLAFGATKEFVDEHQCGKVLDSGDYEGLAKALKEYASLSSRGKEEFSTKCKRLYEGKLEESIFMSAIEACLEEIV